MTQQIISARTSTNVQAPADALSEKYIIQENSHLFYKNVDLKNNIELIFELLENAQLYLSFSITASANITIYIIHEHASASSTVHGILRADDNSVISLTTHQQLLAENSRSFLTVKGVLSDQASLNFKGMISIAAAADQSQAEQTIQTLLIGDHACAQATPSLEILTDNVQCKHASAIGAIDQEQLFYCATRGLATEKAQQLIIDGFLTIP